jgi:DNA-directed RNA polymerase subunit RPC12/RpoP
MAEEVKFKCLRCGHEYKGMYDRKVVEEKKCPKCGSNSIRPLTKKKD